MTDIVDYHDFTTVDTPKKERNELYVGDIYSNEAQCLRCDDIIRSKNKHHYVTCRCGGLSVDGGSHYTKRVFTTDQTYPGFKDLTIYYADVVENKDEE